MQIPLVHWHQAAGILRSSQLQELRLPEQEEAQRIAAFSRRQAAEVRKRKVREVERGKGQRVDVRV